MAHSPEARQAAKALRLYGYTMRQISEKAKVSLGTLYSWKLPKKGNRLEQEKARQRACIVQEARLLRSQGLKLKEISDFLGISYKAVELMRLGPAYISLGCAVCGTEFKKLTNNRRRTCSPQCDRIMRRQDKRRWEKETERGREERRRSSERHRKKYAARRPLRACKMCGANIEQGSTARVCSEICRKQAEKQATVEWYDRNRSDINARSRARALKKYENDPEKYRRKRRRTRRRDIERYRDENWRYSVRRSLGCEPTKEMWELLVARRQLHRELGWHGARSLGKVFVE